MDEQSWTMGRMLIALCGALGIGAMLSAYLSETFRAVLPDPRRLVRRLRRFAKPGASDDRFRILLADLARDPDLDQTDHVAAAFDGIEGFQLVKIGPGPRWTSVPATAAKRRPATSWRECMATS